MSSFVARYKQDWDELEALLGRARKWTGRLSSPDRQRIDELYRRTTIHFARATTSTSDPHLIEYLNNLTAAAHSIIYLPPRDSIVEKLGMFFVEGFARAIARHWRQHLISAVLLVGGALLGYFVAMNDPVMMHALWPGGDVRQPGSTPEQLLAVLRSGRDGEGGEKFAFASFLFQHNLKVGLLAMATGVLAAAPTVVLMIFNGMLMGVFAAIHHQAGIRSEMWAWILPHGVTEFGAIILFGGVGLMLGRAVVRPGAVSRNQSLLDAGREAARICAGAGGMLVLAALIESYIRQSHWPTDARLIFAASTGVFWATYIAFGFNRERQDRGDKPRGSPSRAERAERAAGFIPAVQPTANSLAVVQRID